jgi:acyl dehydratase
MARGDERGGGGRLYLEDFHVGQRFTSATHRIDAAQIKTFAQQFDPQPFHLDEEAAKGTLFGRLVASGWHTAAISMRLQVESGLPIAGGMRRSARAAVISAFLRSKISRATNLSASYNRQASCSTGAAHPSVTRE